MCVCVCVCKPYANEDFGTAYSHVDVDSGWFVFELQHRDSHMPRHYHQNDGELVVVLLLESGCQGSHTFSDFLGIAQVCGRGVFGIRCGGRGIDVLW